MKNKVATFLIFFIIAGIFWFIIKLNEEYTINVSVPVKIDMRGSNFALESEVPRLLNVKVKGSGWNIIHLKYIANPVFKIKTKDIQETTIIRTTALTNESFHLPSSIKILFIEPEEIRIKVNSAMEKKVKVYPDITLSFDEGYDIVSPIRVEPESIIIRGSRKILGKIDSIPTKKIELNNLSQAVNIDVLLDDDLTNLISYDKETVKINFDVQQIVDKEFEKIPVQIINTPLKLEVICLPSFVNVKLRGGINILGSMNNDSIKVFVDFKKFNSSLMEFITPEFILPFGVKVIDYYPKQFKLIQRE